MAKKTKTLYSFDDHPEHRDNLKPTADKWIANALSTSPIDEGERGLVRTAMGGLYSAANLTPPKIGLFVSSPLVGAIAVSVASGARWLRNNPKETKKLFGRVPTESELMACVAVAARVCMDNCLRSYRGEPVTPVPATAAATLAATLAATHAATRDATAAATLAATLDAPLDATLDATLAATHAATLDATHAATAAAIRATTRDSTSAATLDATIAATSAATIATTEAATRDATAAAIHAATSDATSAATDDATIAATSAATDDATSDATLAATLAAIDAATHAATSAATDAATSAATDAATAAATRDATHAATSATTDAATSAATAAATLAATRDATPNPFVSFLVNCAQYWWKFWNGGNMWSGWVGYLSFFRHVAKLPLDYSKFDHYEQLTLHSGPRFMHEDFWLVSDRPEILRYEPVPGDPSRNRPHCADGPTHRWRDGVELFHIHGIRVSARAVSGFMTAKEISEERNAEVRRVLISNYNKGDTGRYVRDLGATVLHQDVDALGLPRRLLRIEQEGDEPILAIEVTNSTPEHDGTRKIYTFRCHPELRPLAIPGVRSELGEPQAPTCLNAIASTYGYTGEEYQLSTET